MKAEKEILMTILAISVITAGGCAPQIDSIDPPEAKAGDVITITGRGFGEYVPSLLGTVTFNGYPVDYALSWSDTEIRVAVPALATSGPVEVRVADFASNPLDFTVVTTPNTVRVMSFNIGNPFDEEPNYPLRLSYQNYEDYVGGQIRALAPDVVVLQEVLSKETCEGFVETDPARACYDHEIRPDPIRRILGDDYTIVCDQRQHVECIGVHVDFGSIQGVALGDYELSGAYTPALPLEECVYFAGECDEDHCDAESTMSSVTVNATFGTLTVVHAHPSAPGFGSGPFGVTYFYSGYRCRTLQLRQIWEGLEGETPLAGGERNLVLGDFNFDPDILAYPDEREVWWTYVGEDRPFTDHGPLSENGTPYHTVSDYPAAIDHVLTDSAEGICTVFGGSIVKPHPVNPPLDDGFDFAGIPDGPNYEGRIDHRAIFCVLEFE